MPYADPYRQRQAVREAKRRQRADPAYRAREREQDRAYRARKRAPAARANRTEVGAT